MVEPGNEQAHCVVLANRARRGDVSGALAVHARFERRLRDELDAEPAKETVELVTAIRSGALSMPRRPNQTVRKCLTPQRRTIVPRRTQPSVVFGPLKMLGSRKPELASVAALVRGEVLDKLTRFREFNVLDVENERRPAVMSCDHIALWVNGKVRTFGNALRVSLRIGMFDAPDILWNEAFAVDAAVSDCTTAAVAAALADALRFHFSATDEVGGRSDCQRARLLWECADRLIWQLDRESELEAKRLLERAVVLDRDFARAHASLADCYSSAGELAPGHIVCAGHLEKACRVAMRAVELDPYDARNHLSLAWSLMRAKRFEPAVFHFERAVELNPSDCHVLISSALGLAYADHTGIAQELVGQASQTSRNLPAHFNSYHASVSLLSGSAHDAVQVLTESPTLYPEDGAWLAAAIGNSGATRDARSAGRRFVDELCATAVDFELTGDRVANWLRQITPLAAVNLLRTTMTGYVWPGWHDADRFPIRAAALRVSADVQSSTSMFRGCVERCSRGETLHQKSASSNCNHGLR